MFKKYIYIKKCCHCDLLYLGITKEIKKYKGSGKYWNNHLKKHKCNQQNIFVKKFNNEEYFLKCCESLSKFLDVVNSKHFANLMYETGKDGGDTFSGKSKEEQEKIRKKLSESSKGQIPWNKGKKGKPNIKKARLSTQKDRNKKFRVRYIHNQKRFTLSFYTEKEQKEMELLINELYQAYYDGKKLFLR